MKSLYSIDSWFTLIAQLNTVYIIQQSNCWPTITNGAKHQGAVVESQRQVMKTRWRDIRMKSNCFFNLATHNQSFRWTCWETKTKVEHRWTTLNTADEWGFRVYKRNLGSILIQPCFWKVTFIHRFIVQFLRSPMMPRNRWVIFYESMASIRLFTAVAFVRCRRIKRQHIRSLWNCFSFPKAHKSTCAQSFTAPCSLNVSA